MNHGPVQSPRRRTAKTLLCASLLLAWTWAAAQTNDLGRAVALNGTKTGVAACIACHGMQGEGDMIGGFPRIAGLSSTYIEAQLSAYARGERQSSLMQTPAEHLSAEERQAVAQYFSQLPPYIPPQTLRDPEPATPDNVGAWLATRGRWKQGLAACAQCHGATGLGVGAAFPPLTGQAASYLALQLQSWKNGTRAPGPMALMPQIAGKLSDSEISAVAAYYGGPTAPLHNSPWSGAKP